MPVKATVPAWRGVVLHDGTIWAWPMLLLDHKEAFGILPSLADYRCRWRQWFPGESVDFDPGTSQEDRDAVNAWIERTKS